MNGSTRLQMRRPPSDTSRIQDNGETHLLARSGNLDTGNVLEVDGLQHIKGVVVDLDHILLEGRALHK